MKKWFSLFLAVALLVSTMAFAVADEQIVITMMTIDNSDSAYLVDFIAQYEADHPNIKIEHTATVNAELKKQLRIGALSGEMPDIVSIDNPDYASFAAGGYMMDITDMVADWEELPLYYDAVISAVTYKDRLYGLPHEANCLGFFYNEDILNRAGYTVPESWTWADVEAACEAVAALNEGIYGMAIAAPQGEVATFQFIPWLYSAGGNYTKLDTEPAVTALSFLTGLIEKGYMSLEVLNYSHGNLTNAFMGQQCAMMVNGSWATAGLADAGFNWACTTIPVLNAGDPSVTDLGGYHAGITATCKHPEEALDVLKAYCGAYWSERSAIQNGTLPTRSDVAQDSRWQEYPISVFVEAMSDAVSRVNPFWPELSQNIYTAMQAAMSGTMTPEEALNNAEALNAAYWGF